MTQVDITMQDKHLHILRSQLLRADGAEHAAYVLFGISRIAADPFTGEHRLRLIVRDILAVEPDEIASSDATHISWRTTRLVNLLGQAAGKGTRSASRIRTPLVLTLSRRKTTRTRPNSSVLLKIATAQTRSLRACSSRVMAQFSVEPGPRPTGM